MEDLDNGTYLPVQRKDRKEEERHDNIPLSTPTTYTSTYVVYGCPCGVLSLSLFSFLPWDLSLSLSLFLSPVRFS